MTHSPQGQGRDYDETRNSWGPARDGGRAGAGRRRASRRPAGKGQAGRIREDLFSLRGGFLLHPRHRHLPARRRLCVRGNGRQGPQRGGGHHLQRHGGNHNGQQWNRDDNYIAVARTWSRHPRRTQQHGLRHAARVLRGRRELRKTGSDRSEPSGGSYRRQHGPRVHPVRGLHGGLHRIVLQLRRCLLDRRQRLAARGTGSRSSPTRRSSATASRPRFRSKTASSGAATSCKCPVRGRAASALALLAWLRRPTFTRRRRERPRRPGLGLGADHGRPARSAERKRDCELRRDNKWGYAFGGGFEIKTPQTGNPNNSFLAQGTWTKGAVEFTGLGSNPVLGRIDPWLDPREARPWDLGRLPRSRMRGHRAPPARRRRLRARASR